MKGRKYGDNLGGIRTLEDLRVRCWINPETGCWEWRGAMQRTPDRNPEPRVWLANERVTSTIGRAAWNLAGKRKLPSGYTVWRTCRCESCGNPEHLRSGTKAQWGAWMAAKGGLKGDAARRLKNRQSKIDNGQAKITAEIARWVIESPQTLIDAAWGASIAKSTASRIRRGESWQPLMPAASVFHLSFGVPMRKAA